MCPRGLNKKKKKDGTFNVARRSRNSVTFCISSLPVNVLGHHGQLNGSCWLLWVVFGKVSQSVCFLSVVMFCHLGCLS